MTMIFRQVASIEVIFDPNPSLYRINRKKNTRSIHIPIKILPLTTFFPG